MTTGQSGGVPTIDLTPWFTGGEQGRRSVAGQVDQALQSVGFFLLTGHTVTRELRARVRRAARAFFALPVATKQRYAVAIGGRGWLPPGVEANGYSEGTETPPDMKESFAVGADAKSGNPEIDAFWFPENVWPVEVRDLRDCVTEYLAAMRSLADELLTIAAVGLQLPSDFFTRHTTHATYTMNVNWYPPIAVAGQPAEGQYRIGPHTDFGTFTILDREPGKGGLQVWSPQDEWEDAPYDPEAFFSPSIPVTCLPGGLATGGSPTGIGYCRRRPTRPTRTWSRWSSSTRRTGTRSSNRCSRRWARRTPTRR